MRKAPLLLAPLLAVLWGPAKPGGEGAGQLPVNAWQRLPAGYSGPYIYARPVWVLSRGAASGEFELQVNFPGSARELDRNP